jgi:hypothetical protein
MNPLEWRAGRIKGHGLRFNLEGRPKGKSAPANISLDPDTEVCGVLYKITRRDLLHLDSTEGVPGRRYRPIWIEAEDFEGHPLMAVTYIAQGNEIDGNPSLRYVTLLREGARAHGVGSKNSTGRVAVSQAASIAVPEAAQYNFADGS